MQELVIMKKGEAVCSSLQVAEVFKKEHYNVLRDIDNLFGQVTALNFEVSKKNVESLTESNFGCSKKNMELSKEEFTELNFELSKKMFFQSTYKDSTGKSNKMYYMNRDGFSLLVMGFTGKKALEWKLKYIQAFHQMEDVIKRSATKEYIQARNTGRVTRKQEADVLKDLVEYAKGQGSKHPEKLYVVYSNLANKTVGIQNRRFATPSQLNNLALVESIMMHTIQLDIKRQMHYKDIYKDCKAKMETLSSIAYLAS